MCIRYETPIGLLRFLLLWTPLSARRALKELGTLLGRQLLDPWSNVVRPGPAVLPGSSLLLELQRTEADSL